MCQPRPPHAADQHKREPTRDITPDLCKSGLTSTFAISAELYPSSGTSRAVDATGDPFAITGRPGPAPRAL